MVEKPRVRFNYEKTTKMNDLMQGLQLNTVCEEATCPNLGECFSSGTATFMILGKNCSRNCRFCDVNFGGMELVNPHEPMNVAVASSQLQLNHVVVTSVARDDLPDGGAFQFAQTIKAIKEVSPNTTVEVLIPDFMGNKESLDAVIAAGPEIINHNLETVERLSPKIRHRATYKRSLEVLTYIKEQAPEIFTKTGIMLGIGEQDDEVEQMMEDAIAAGVDFLTIGQYLQPSEKHYPIEEYVSMRKFGIYRRLGMKKGFKFVASSPAVRSSYKALEAYQRGVLNDIHTVG
ncbi:lipoyl synthase [Floricoccus tropicus]|uniref:Lipoyl synthase n=1 Tax=Floricoccus tropicus TaxID=1859473 RepID=A0A1E8GKM0_9LACT|nr:MULTISPECIES: lipoyl synthase [Floricoccus]OFI48213.1 lipoyl synthase [Floricoccus tropicus]URZ87098.1 lipoyl synthase [Floricoccus penangensis]